MSKHQETTDEPAKPAADSLTINNAEALLDAGECLAGIEPRMAALGIDHDIIVVLEGEPGLEGNLRVRHAKEITDALVAERSAPKRRIHTAALLELESFIATVQRFKSEESVVYADPGSFSVVAVFDEHPRGPDHGAAAWREHRATYSCPRSPEWLAWCEIDGKPLPQEKFADFIEARLEDLRSKTGYPAPLDMLTMSRNLLVKTKGTFERAFDPTTGNGILVNKTENDTGSTEIPRAFVLGIPVFDSGDPYEVEARIRLSVNEGRASFVVNLHRRKEIERDAFQGIRNTIVLETSLPVLAGRA